MVNTCEHISLFQKSDHILILSHVVDSRNFCPVFFLPFHLPSHFFFPFFGGAFPFRSCSVFLHRRGLSAGLVLPTFSLYGTRRGVRPERKGKASEAGWEEGRGDGCKTGRETEEERETRRSQSRETGSSTSKLNLPSQRGLAFYPSIFEEFISKMRSTTLRKCAL